MTATGSSRAATGTITSNTDSTLTLVEPSSHVLITNEAAVTFACRINGAVTATEFDFKIAPGERVWVRDIEVQTVHVYGAATAGLRVVAW